MKNADKMKEAIVMLLDLFRDGKIPEKIAIATHPRFDVPSTRWSLNNKLIQLIYGTFDSRGIRQWRDVKRRVKKGAKAVYILAPVESEIYKCQCGKVLVGKALKMEFCNSCKDEIKKNEIKRTIYFKCVPVFRVEDTHGKSLAYENITVPKHHFMNVAKAWGIEVKASAFNGSVYGYCDPGKKIVLASPDEDVFFHELAHEAHHRLGMLRKGGQKPANEIVAEFCASVLVAMQGKKLKVGNSYEYLEQYARLENHSVEKAVMLLLSEIEKVLDLILKTEKSVHESNIALNDAGAMKNTVESSI